jgi:hypothetical protein
MSLGNKQGEVVTLVLAGIIVVMGLVTLLTDRPYDNHHAEDNQDHGRAGSASHGATGDGGSHGGHH